MNEPLKNRVRKPKTDRADERQRLLAKFDMISEEELATLFGVEVRTLKNRAPNDLPPFTKTGGKRLFFKDDVTVYLRRRMSN